MNIPLAFLPSGAEWIWIAVIVLILFGGAKLPQLMRGIGRGAGELQKGIEEGKKMIQEHKDSVMNSPEETPAAPPKTEPTEPPKAS